MNPKRKTSKELDKAISMLMRVVRSEGVGLVRDERVRSALRELQQSRKGGQEQSARIARAAALICEVACEVLIDSGDDSERAEQ